MGANYKEVYGGFRPLERLRRVYERGGIRHVVVSFLRLIWRNIKIPALHLWLKVRPPRWFTFQKKRYRYVCDKYNTTWQNERAVELPIALTWIQAYRGKRILEVGYVVGHYFGFSHRVIDKYELSPGVERVDVVEFAPQEQYDLIISVSTMEHVGFDEEAKDPQKLLRAFAHLRDRCLAPSGKLVVTLPLGYNPDLDLALESGRLHFDELYALRRIVPWTWEESTWPAVRGSSYDFTVPSANAVLIGIIRK